MASLLAPDGLLMIDPTEISAGGTPVHAVLTRISATGRVVRPAQRN